MDWESLREGVSRSDEMKQRNPKMVQLGLEEELGTGIDEKVRKKN